MKTEILSLRHVNFWENGKKELDEFSLKIFLGDILALMNIDYQGLSALKSLIIFNRRLESGQMLFCGKETCSADFCQKKMNKAAAVEKETHLIPSLNICDNFFFIKEKSPFFVNKKKSSRQIRQIFKDYGMDFTGFEFASDLSKFECCKLEIIRACSTGYKLIILNNLSSFLNSSEMKEIHALVKKIAAGNKTAFLYLSTDFADFSAVCNRFAVMRNGSILYTRDTDSISDDMIRNFQKDFEKTFSTFNLQKKNQNGEVIAEIKAGDDFNISIYKNECLVLLDLDNKIIKEISDALLNQKSSSVFIEIEGKNAFKNKNLFSYISENPSVQAVFPHLSFVDNLVMKKMNSNFGRFWLVKKFQSSVKKEFSALFGEKMELQDLRECTQKDLYSLIYQRVLIEKPEVLFVYHPFDELDMMQRVRNMEKIYEIQRTGCTVVILAITPTEFFRIASRILVIKNNRISEKS